MSEFVENGKERYVAANQQEVYERYEKRVAEIKEFYAASAPRSFLKRWLQRVWMQRDVARVKRELFGSDILYFSEINTDLKGKFLASLDAVESL